MTSQSVPLAGGQATAYSGHVDCLLNRFSELIQQCQKEAFPPVRTGIVAPPDTAGWSKARKIAFGICSPWPATLTSATGWTNYVLLLWLAISLYWLAAADVFADGIFGPPAPPSTWPTGNALADAFAVAVVVVMIILALAAYWSWGQFFRDRRFRLWLRAALFAGFVATVASTPYWLLEPAYRAQLPDRLFEDRMWVLFALMYALCLIPAFTCWYRVVLDVAALGLRIVWMTVQYGRSAHNPLPTGLIRKLAVEPIPCGEGEGEWRLGELTRRERESLHAWARANRDSTEKRLLPTMVVFGIIAVLAEGSEFSGSIGEALRWVYNSATLYLARDPDASSFDVVANYMAALLVCSVVLLVAQWLLALFRNLVTQSLIAETCLVAEYSCEQCEPAGQGGQVVRRRGERVSWWERVRRRLGKG